MYSEMTITDPMFYPLSGLCCIEYGQMFRNFVPCKLSLGRLVTSKLQTKISAHVSWLILEKGIVGVVE